MTDFDSNSVETGPVCYLPINLTPSKCKYKEGSELSVINCEWYTIHETSVIPYIFTYFLQEA